MMMKKILILTIIAVITASCGVYKKYKRPEVATDNLYGDNIPAGDTATIGNLAWGKLFTDPALQNLIAAGLQYNTDLRIARLRTEEAAASLRTARLAYLPSVSLTPQGTLSSFDGEKTMKTYQLSGTASWEADIFGRLTNAKRGARAALEESHAYRQAVQTQLIATIAASYYTLLMLDAQVSISEETAANWQENVKTLQALKNAGQTTEAAVSQAEANRLAVEASLKTLRQQLNETENSLCTLLGRTPQAVARGTLGEQQFPGELAYGLPLQLLANRPDVRQAEAALAQAFYATGEARSAFYPGITLSGSAGWTNSAGAAITNPGALLLQAVGSLVQPLFNKGANTARLKIAKAQQEEALLTFQQSLLNAGAEVNNALVRWQTARDRILLGEQQVSALQEAVRSTSLLMQHGTVTYLEVLTAQQSLLQAELTQASDRFDEIQGVIDLYHALGGGRE